MTDSPHCGPDIAVALRALHDESVSYWSTLSTGSFLAPIGDAWSPAENVRHLTKSIRAVSVGLRAPRLVLWMRFGSARGPGRRYEEVRETYRARLARGDVRAGRFSPDPRPEPADSEAERTRIMAYHRIAVEQIAELIGRWPESALDRRRIPHPLLGLLSVREMLLFTLYHNRHHLDNVRRRLGNGAA